MREERMSKLSEQVQNQIKVSEKVVASARTHAKKVAEELAARDAAVQGSDAKKTTAKAYETAILAFAARLTHATEELRERELEYTAERADDGPIREARDAAVRDLLALMIALRGTVETTLGRSALTTYGLGGETPRVPRKLLNHVQNVARLMTKTPASVKTEFGSSFNSGTAAASLEKKHAELDALIKDDDREARELETALTKRDRAAATWSETYQGTASALEGMYRLAGWRELADRVRPTQRALRGEDAGAEIQETAPTDGSPQNETGVVTGASSGG
jgi:hypothetical protein